MIADLTDKAALVTGGASGIGRGICLALAGQGADLVVADMNGPGAESVAAEVAGLGLQAAALVVDVTDRASVDSMVAQAVERFGRIDILVNDAGVVGAPGWWEREIPSDEDWEHAFAVNLRGLALVSEIVGPHMKERRYGKIINIGSIAARLGGTDIPHYNASKAGVVSWTQSNALQLAPFDINVNAICPGLLWTPMFERIAEKRVAFDFEPRPPRAYGPGVLREAGGVLDPDEEGADARGHREARRLPRLRRRPQHHRPGHQRRRRQAHELERARAYGPWTSMPGSEPTRENQKVVREGTEVS